MIGVAITADSRREWSCGATRYNWIVAPGWTDVEIKKSRLSLVARLLSDLFLPDDLRSHKPTHWSVWAFQQRLAQSESRLSEQYICLSSWQLLVLLLILLLGQLRLHMSRQTTMTSQTRDFPLCHGTKVSPSGRFPSDRHKPYYYYY